MIDSIITGDCISVMKQIPDHSVPLIVTDPPYNIGFSYDQYNDRLPVQEYLAWCRSWMKESRRVLRKNGSLFVVIGDEFAADYKLMLDDLGLTMRSWIIWHYTFGQACINKLARSHAHIFYYVADPDDFSFEADAIRVPSARQLVYNDRRANSRGKLPDDVWVLRPQDDARFYRNESDTWYEPRICGTFKERKGTPNQLPEKLVERMILMSSKPGDLVLDPFAGSGTTAVVSKRLGRKYIGIELSIGYAEIARKRLTDE